MSALFERLDALPRVPLAHLPTPLEPLDRLLTLGNGPRLWVKREDCTGLGMGGNKVRKLEYILADTIAQGADTVVSGGVIQSNHARQVAAAAAKLGLECHLVLMTGRVPHVGPEYHLTGNVFLDQLFGAQCTIVDWTGDRNLAIDIKVEDLRGAGKRPYRVPYGGSNLLGTLAFVQFARELNAQAEGLGITLDAVVHASGTGGTQAGIAVGMAAISPETEVIGIDIDAEPERVKADVERLAGEAADYLGAPALATHREIEVASGYAGPAYGVPTPSTLLMIQHAAAREGLLLDPVYSGKGLDGLNQLIGIHRRWGEGQNVVFVHTGGTPGLFAYRSAFDPNQQRPG
jgi:L-cysteate sulfo-lyase